MEAKERILGKAHELFNRFGFRRVTMDEIALKSGMSKKTIYQSFANKDELVEAVVEENIKKSVAACEQNSTKAENAVHEIFLSIDIIQDLMSEMNPVIFEEMEKFFPAAFMKFFHHKNNYFFHRVQRNLKQGIEEGLFRPELNIDVITKFRIETMFIPCNQDVFPHTKYNLAEVEIETLELYLYGISTIEGQKLIRKYKEQQKKIIKMSKQIQMRWMFTLVLTVIVNFTFSQKRYELTVREAVELAFKNVAEVKNAGLDIKIQKAQNKEITGQALPQVAGTASVNRYLQLPQILFPASQEGIYKVLVDEGLLPQGTKAPPPIFQAVSFVQPWNASLGATLSQLLFQPDVFVGLQARKTALGYSEANYTLVKERIKDSAYRRYYAILIAEKQADFLKGGIERLQRLYHDDSIMFKNGFAERLDLDKVQVQLTNLQTSESVLKSSIKLAYAALKYSIGISQNDTVILKEGLTNEDIKQNVLDDNFKYEDRKEIQAMTYSRRLQELDVKRHKMGYLPTLSAVASYSYQGMGRQFITNNNTIWFESTLVGLSLNLPIFDGFQRKYKIQQAKFNLQKVDNAVDNLKQVIDLQQTASKESLKNALLNLDAQQRNVGLAESVYNTTKKKFEAGLGSSFEVLQADNDWQIAQSNYFTGLYNAIIAKIAYQSSLGKLE